MDAGAAFSGGGGDKAESWTLHTSSTGLMGHPAIRTSLQLLTAEHT